MCRTSCHTRVSSDQADARKNRNLSQIILPKASLGCPGLVRRSLRGTPPIKWRFPSWPGNALPHQCRTSKPCQRASWEARGPF